MNSFKKILLFLILIVGTLYSYQPSSESTNPFNKYLSLNTDVDLFSGVGTSSLNLVSLISRGTVNLTVNLAYSSNVDINARSRNDVAPTGWVGLGWNLGFGKIVCNHNGTMTDADDDYVWISPEGVVMPILYKNAIYYIKDRPYWKVQKIKVGSFVSGWILTDETGKKYRYGDCNESSLKQNNLNWNTLCWEATGFVGDGFAGEPVPFPYQWDLAEIVDIEGSWIRFKYIKYNGDVSYGPSGSPTWSPANNNKYYTRESYISEITTDKGTTVEFITDNKDANEYYAPFSRTNFTDGKETMQPVYETKYLKNIIVRNSFSTLEYAEKIYFYYDFINTNSLFMKRLLSRVSIENGKEDNGIKGTNITWFKYYITETEPNGCYGALKSIKNHLGAERLFEYEKKVLNQSHEYITKLCENCSGPELKTGTTSDGEDYYVAVDPEDNRYLHVWTYFNSDVKEFISWFSDPITKNNVFTAHNYFIVTYGDPLTMRIFHWDGGDLNDGVFNHSWKEEEYSPAWDIIGSIKNIYPQETYFLVQNNNDVLWTYTRDRSTATWSGYEGPTLNDWRGVVCGSKYYSLFNPDGNVKFYYVIPWNGNTNYWGAPRTITREHAGVKRIIGGSDNFIEFYEPESDNEFFYSFKYNGTDWGSFFEGGESRVQWDVRSPYIYCGNNFFVINNIDKEADKSDSRIYNWNGNVWRHTKTIDKGYTIPVGNNIFIAQEHFDDPDEFAKRFTTWKWEPINGAWYNGDYGSDVYIGYKFDLKIGDLFQVAEFKDGSDLCHARVNIWDGRGWKTEDFGPETVSPPSTMEEGYNICGRNSFFRITKMVKTDDGQISYYGFLRRKFLDSFKNAPYSYVVKKLIIKNGSDLKDLEFEYEYETITAKYNAAAGISMFKKVTKQQTGGSAVTYYFENEVFRFMGALKKTETNITSQQTEYDIYYKSDWPANLYQKRVIKTVTTKDGVKIEQEMQYNITNGMVCQTTETNSDGKQKINEIIYAYEKAEYADMKNRNMLAQPFLNKTLYKENEGATPVVISANATVWKDYTIGSDKRWRPLQGYVWNVPMGPDGLPLPGSEYTYSDYALSGSSNSNWNSTWKKEKYDEWGRIIETSDAIDLHNVTIMGNKDYRKIASIENASYDECAFYSCNYDNSVENPGYLDYRNGWEIGTKHSNPPGIISLDNNVTHFGRKSIFISNSEGPTRRITGIQPGKDYIFSAWVLPTNSNPVTLGAQINGEGADLLKEFENLTIGKWQLIVSKLSKEKLSSMQSGDYLKIWVGNQQSDPVCVLSPVRQVKIVLSGLTLNDKAT